MMNSLQLEQLLSLENSLPSLNAFGRSTYTEEGEYATEEEEGWDWNGDEDEEDDEDDECDECDDEDEDEDDEGDWNWDEDEDDEDEYED
ncbi:hypothetical protein KJZ61_03370 [Candidatus Dependentiae bacterium]|nr:hypothetical protein [Candidatus Dependentiae bacterium]